MYPDIARARGLAVEITHRYQLQRAPINILDLAKRLNIHTIPTTFRAEISNDIHAVYNPENDAIQYNPSINTADIMVSVAKLIGSRLLYPKNTNDDLHAVWGNTNRNPCPKDMVVNAFVSHLLVNRDVLYRYCRSNPSTDALAQAFCVPNEWMAQARSELPT